MSAPTATHPTAGRRAPSRRRAVGAVAGVAAVLLAAAPTAQAAPAAAVGANPKGVQLEPGQAYLGWSNPSSGSPVQARAAAGSATPAAAARVSGIDVSSYQQNVPWSTYYGQGFRFAYVKATEGNYYVNNYFTQQYNGSYNAGFIRGSYHFARPDIGTGAAQADYFIARGGGWSRDGKTLPGVLDIEFNPYGSTCYGLSQSGMVSWIRSFTSRYKYRTGRDAVIYTNTSWWKQCTGNNGSFGATNPLWVANYSTSTPPLPAGWSYYTFFQWTSTPLDKDYFNGAYDRLQALANG